MRQCRSRVGIDSRRALRRDFFRCGHARQRRYFAAGRFEGSGSDHSDRDDFRPGQRGDRGTRHPAGGRGFSREAAFHRKTAGHHRKCAAPAPSRGRKSRSAAASRQARSHLGRTRHAAAAGASRARGRQRIARGHPRRDRYGEGADRSSHPSEKRAAYRPVRYPQLRRRPRRPDRIRIIRP